LFNVRTRRGGRGSTILNPIYTNTVRVQAVRGRLLPYLKVETMEERAG